MKKKKHAEGGRGRNRSLDRTNELLEQVLAALNGISTRLEQLRDRATVAPVPAVPIEKRRRIALEVLALTQAPAFREVLKQINDDFDTPGMMSS